MVYYSSTLWGISMSFSIAIAVLIAVCCVYCKGCPYYRHRSRGPNRNVGFIVGQNNVAYYDQHGNPIILTPNNQFVPFENQPPPPYQMAMQQQQQQPMSMPMPMPQPQPAQKSEPSADAAVIQPTRY